MSHLRSGIAVIGIDIGKNSFHLVGQGSAKSRIVSGEARDRVSLWRGGVGLPAYGFSPLEAALIPGKHRPVHRGIVPAQQASRKIYSYPKRRFLDFPSPDRPEQNPVELPDCTCQRGMKPSVSVCMKATSASSSASDKPSRPMNLVFMLSVDSGAGQHVVPSPGSLGLQRGRTSRVL
jgi:hypothetical protein